jgi:hypothetical protein
MENEIQKFFKLKSDKCCRTGCEAKALWQPVFLIFADCETKCGTPHFQAPGVMIADSGLCNEHKTSMTLDKLLDTGEFWDKLCREFRSQDLRESRKDWTAISLHRIPDNLVQFTGPKLVSPNPEPQPPVA